MKNSTKIATCCYCGSRSILKLTARSGHELACGSCGAPLHDLKWLKSPRAPVVKHGAQPQTRRFSSAPSKRKRKKRKPIWRRVIEEVWDEVEDIFD